MQCMCHVTDLANSKRPAAELRASGGLLFSLLHCPGLAIAAVILMVTIASFTRVTLIRIGIRMNVYRV